MITTYTDKLVFYSTLIDTPTTIQIFPYNTHNYGLISVLHSGTPSFTSMIYSLLKLRGFKLQKTYPYDIISINDNTKIVVSTEKMLFKLLKKKEIPINRRISY